MDIKTQRYTTAQIQEAISFWTKILENKSRFLDALVDDFGYDYVFNANRKIQIRLKDIEKISQLANSVIFDGKLAHIDVVEDENDEHFSQQNIFMSYGFTIYFDPNANEWKLLRETGQSADGIIYSAPKLYVSKYALDVQMHLITFASIIVHEVIHQHIIENARNEQLLKLANPSDNSHNDEFILLMKKINAEFGLNITVNGSGKYDENLVDVLRKFVGSDYRIAETDVNSECRFKQVRHLSDKLIQIDLY